MIRGSLDRRALIAAGAGLAAASPALASVAAKPQPKPMAFDPKAVPGLSESC